MTPNIDGIAPYGALKLIAEIGTDLSRWPTEQVVPRENVYVESFNGKLRDELLDREIFYTLTEAKILIERWRREYNTVRPYNALDYRPPAAETVSPVPLSGVMMSPGGQVTEGSSGWR